jgi:anti-sigma factor ChrR (cupin superfamily)
MRLNADFDRPAHVVAAGARWVPSPAAGVTRLPLDRVGEEVARATSLVRYEADSAFAAHAHPGGEEYLVLEGVFSDEAGDHPVGSYVRNPPGTRHTPGSGPGCVLFVKLWQFRAGDGEPVDLRAPATLPAAAVAPGVALRPLHAFAEERVELVDLAPQAVLPATPSPGGAEMLVIAGTVEVAGRRLGPWDWLRLPADGADAPSLATGEAPARVWRKTGHLSPDALAATIPLPG